MTMPRRAIVIPAVLLATALLGACTDHAQPPAGTTTSAPSGTSSTASPTTTTAPSSTTTSAAANTPTSPPATPSGATSDPGARTAAGPGAPEAPTPTATGVPGTSPEPDATGATRLTALDGAAREGARRRIAALPTKGRAARTGYARTLFGQTWTDDAGDVLWSHNGCGTRDDVLARDLDAIARRNACVVTAGTFVDPYTGATQQFAKANADRWPIDHVVPLAYAYVMGARTWTDLTRTEFANDPLNLVVTTAATNTAKGDSGPASWLPPNAAIRCGYADRFARVVAKYALPVTPADKDTLAAQCR